jgi:hypothetical protein
MTRQDIIETMLSELQTQTLEVALVPAPEPKHEGHMIRAAISKNPQWYGRLYAQTRCKRKDTVKLFERMASGERPSGKLADLINDLINERFENEKHSDLRHRDRPF